MPPRPTIGRLLPPSPAASRHLQPLTWSPVAWRAQEETTHRESKEAEEALRRTRTELASAAAEWTARRAEQKELLKTVARLEQQLAQSGNDAARRREAHGSASAELERVSAEIAQLEGELEGGRLETMAKRAEAERCAGEGTGVGVEALGGWGSKHWGAGGRSTGGGWGSEQRHLARGGRSYGLPLSRSVPRSAVWQVRRGGRAR